MPDNPIAITDSEMTGKIQLSHLDDNQKLELIALVHEMTDAERAELLGIVEESNTVATAAEADYNEKLGALNAEYAKKLAEATHAETEYVRVEFEKFDNEQKVGEMQTVEAEISASASSGTAPDMSRQSLINKPKSHFFRNLFLLLIALAALAGGALYGLQHL